MNWLKKIKFLAAIMFLCCILASTGLTSCKKGEAVGDEAVTEEAAPAGDSAKSEHPAGESEHPKSDSTAVK